LLIPIPNAPVATTQWLAAPRNALHGHRHGITASGGVGSSSVGSVFARLLACGGGGSDFAKLLGSGGSAFARLLADGGGGSGGGGSDFAWLLSLPSSIT